MQGSSRSSQERKCDVDLSTASRILQVHPRCTYAQLIAPLICSPQRLWHAELMQASFFPLRTQIPLCLKFTYALGATGLFAVARGEEQCSAR